MSKKKLLIVSHGFYPDESPRAYRATELAKEFKRQGHEVTIMCPEKEGLNEFLKKWDFKYISLGKLKWKPVTLNSNNKLFHLLERALYRFLSLGFDYPYIELYFKVKKQLKLNKVNFDALISIAVPYAIHWGVASRWQNEIAHNPAKVWIADCGDPYVGRENDSFKLPFYWAWVEKWFMRKTNFVTVPTPTSYLGYFNEFHDKIIVIPQGFKFQDYQFGNQKNKNEIPVFAYAGLFIPGKRDPSFFCEYLLATKKDFRFHIYTRNFALVDKYRKQAPGKFIINDFMPRMKLLAKLKAEVDFVVNFENAGPRQTPSKIIDYILIDKPILSIKSFDLCNETIDEFLDFNFTNELIIKNTEQYRIDNIAKSFLALCK